jgi:hypothetical protein
VAERAVIALLAPRSLRRETQTAAPGQAAAA